jgi:hypothetical protein
MAELQHPSPPASLSGEGLEGGVAAVRFRRDVACYVCSLLRLFSAPYVGLPLLSGRSRRRCKQRLYEAPHPIK